MISEIKKILYATNLSENARYAFGYAVSLANRYDAVITVLRHITIATGSPDGVYYKFGKAYIAILQK